jgi:defect in organelle trafficking protein DotA
MKKIKNIFITISVLIWQLIPMLGFASDSSLNLWKTKVDVSQDLSLYLLRQFFGQVGGGIESGVGTIMGQIFGVFNAGLVSMTGLFLCYTVMKAITATASEGEAMGKHMSHMLPVRVALGVGLLIPKATGYSVLNVIVMWVVTQGVIFADMAWQTSLNYLNNGGLLYIQPSKTVTAAAPELIDTVLIKSHSSVGEGSDADANSIAKSLVCMHYEEYLAKKTASDVKSDMKDNAINYPKNNQAFNDTLQVPTFTPEWDADKAKTLVYLPGNLSNTPYAAWQGNCGIYKWGWNAATENDQNVYFEAKRIGLQQLVADIDSIAKYMVDAITNLPASTKYNEWILKYADMGAGLILDSSSNYQSIIYPARVEYTKGYAKNSDQGGAMQFYQDAVKYGWITAGRYYYSIMMLSTSNTTAPDTSHYKYQLKSNEPPGMIALANGSSPNQALSNFGQRGGQIYNQSNIPTSADNILSFWSQNQLTGGDMLGTLLKWVDTSTTNALALADQIKANIIAGGANAATLNNLTFPEINTEVFNPSVPNDWCPGGVCLGAKFSDFFRQKPLAIANDIVNTPLANNLRNIYGKWKSLLVDNEGNYPAVVKLQKLGVETIAGCVQFWEDILDKLSTYILVYFGVSTGLTAILTIVGLVPWYGGPLQNIVNGVLHIVETVFKLFVELPVLISLPIAFAIITPIFVVGVILAFYVPMIPFMLFTFGTISWLIFVIEAMAAAPIVALGITHPEGHDLLGKSEQAQMLLLSVFVRPITMVIGLIAAIILANISLEILNMGYGYAVSSALLSTTASITTPVGDTTKNVYDMLRVGFIVLLYPFIALPIVNQCFSLIYLIPEKIMRWIGLHPEASMEAQMLEQVKGSVTSQAESLGRGAGESTSRAAGGLQGFGPKSPIAMQHKKDDTLRADVNLAK